MRIDYTYDRLNRPTRKLIGANLASGDPLIEDVRLAYGDTLAAPSTEAWTYSYDTLDQLTRATNMGDAALSRIVVGSEPRGDAVRILPF